MNDSEPNRTDRDEARSSGSSGESLSDYTTKQQAIIVAHLEDPDASDATIADRVGSARSYPWHVYERAGDLIESLRAELEAGTSIEELVRRELSIEEIEAIASEGLLDSLDIDVADILAPVAGDFGGHDRSVGGDPRRATSAGPDGRLGSDAPDRLVARRGDGPEDDRRGSSGSRDPWSDAGVALESDGWIGTPEGDVRGSGSAVASGERGEVPVDRIRVLLDRIRFSRRVLERQADADGDGTTPGVNAQLSVLVEVQRELEAVLQSVTDDG